MCRFTPVAHFLLKCLIKCSSVLNSNQSAHLCLLATSFLGMTDSVLVKNNSAGYLCVDWGQLTGVYMIIIHVCSFQVEGRNSRYGEGGAKIDFLRYKCIIIKLL